MHDFPQRARLSHRIPEWVEEGAFFFVTINCVPRRLNQLCLAGPGDGVLAAAAHYHENLRWFCRLLLLMPDHLHGVLAFPRQPGMEHVIKSWKRFLSGEQHIHWQRDFFDHRLRDRNEEQESVSYILSNPVRWGLCRRAEEWNWVYRGEERLPMKLGD
jgi:REP element-mobilizing transposase RayT